MHLYKHQAKLCFNMQQQHFIAAPNATAGRKQVPGQNKVAASMALLLTL